MTSASSQASGSPAFMENPRKLTYQEIQALVDRLPMVMAGCKEVAAFTRKQIQKKVASQIRTIQLIPSGIQKFGDDLVEAFEYSVINPGAAVGLTCSESIGQPATQMSLSSFHTAGSSTTMAGGIDSLQELFSVTMNPKNPAMTIHFQDKNLSYEEVFAKRAEFVGVNVAELIIRSEYHHVDSHFGGGAPGWWYPLFLKVMGREAPQSKHFLRLHLNPVRLNACQITPSKVAMILEALESGNRGLVVCVASPASRNGERLVGSNSSSGRASSPARGREAPGFELPVVDIYPIEEMAIASIGKAGGGTPASIDNYIRIFLQNSVETLLAKTLVQGIPEIRQIFPVSVYTWSIVRSEVQISLPGEFGYWKIEVDPVLLRNIKVPISKLTRLISETLLELSKSYPDCEVICTPDDPEAQEDLHEAQHVKQINWSNRRKFEQALGPLESNIYIIRCPVERNLDRRPRKNQTALEALNLCRKEQSRAGSARFEPARLSEIIKARILDDEVEVKSRTEADKSRSTPYLRSGVYVYAASRGTNLRKILIHKDVDQRRTISNSVSDVYETLGTEAARTVHFKSYNDIIVGNGAYANVRHLALITDFQSSLGPLLSITSRGIARQNIGALAKASFEKAMKAFEDAAAFGKSEDTKSTSTSIFLGRRPYLGTGLFELESDKAGLSLAKTKFAAYLARLEQAALSGNEADKLAWEEIKKLTQPRTKDRRTYLATLQKSGQLISETAELTWEADGIDVGIDVDRATQYDHIASDPNIEAERIRVLTQELHLCAKGPIPSIKNVLKQTGLLRHTMLPPEIAEMLERARGTSARPARARPSSLVPVRSTMETGSLYNQLYDIAAYIGDTKTSLSASEVGKLYKQFYSIASLLD